MKKIVNLALFLLVASAFPVFGAIEVLKGKEGQWRGQRQVTFTHEGRAAWVVVPPKAAPGNPWVWRARFPGFHSEVDDELVKRGYHIAHINTGGMLGSPAAMEVWDGFYDRMVSALDLNPKVVLEGVSRGGLFIYNWAARNPERVACMYADTPVLDFKSWPLGQGTGKGDPNTWKGLLKQYGLTHEEALEYEHIPINSLEPLAKAGIPIRHIVSRNDLIVPPAENTDVVVERYRALGGSIHVVNVAEGNKLHGHHFPLVEIKETADFIERNTPLPPLPDPEGWVGWYGGRQQFIQHARVTFEQKKQGRVVYLGGSITEGRGWQDMVSAHLKQRFPETQFDFINAGISSLGSTAHAFRVMDHAFGKGPVDLLFVEAAVNDLHVGQPPEQVSRAYEGVVRQVREKHPHCDIILMHFAEPRHTADYQAGKVPWVIERHEAIARHYGLVSLNLALEVHDRLAAAQFSWDKDFRNLHPSPFGQRLYFQTIKRLLDRTWIDAPDEQPDAPSHRVPEVLNPGAYSRGALVQPDAVTLNGFTVDPKWRVKTGKFRKRFVDVPMLVGAKPGDAFSFSFEGDAFGVFAAAGPGSGAVDYRIDGGEWQTREIWTKWSGGLHIPQAFVLADQLPEGPHTVEIRVSETRPDHPKAGTQIRLRWVLVNGTVLPAP